MRRWPGCPALLETAVQAPAPEMRLDGVEVTGFAELVVASGRSPPPEANPHPDLQSRTGFARKRPLPLTTWTLRAKTAQRGRELFKRLYEASSARDQNGLIICNSCRHSKFDAFLSK